MRKENTGQKTYPYNVSAMEGEISSCFKESRHPHTNMAKCRTKYAYAYLFRRIGQNRYIFYECRRNTGMGFTDEDARPELAKMKQEVYDFQPGPFGYKWMVLPDVLESVN